MKIEWVVDLSSQVLNTSKDGEAVAFLRDLSGCITLPGKQVQHPPHLFEVQVHQTPDYPTVCWKFLSSSTSFLNLGAQSCTLWSRDGLNKTWQRNIITHSGLWHLSWCHSECMVQPQIKCRTTLSLPNIFACWSSCCVTMCKHCILPAFLSTKGGLREEQKILVRWGRWFHWRKKLRLLPMSTYHILICHILWSAKHAKTPQTYSNWKENMKQINNFIMIPSSPYILEKYLPEWQ